MATVEEPRTAEAAPRSRGKGGPRRWRWTARQFHKLANRGYFGDHKVELVDGELYELAKNPPHDTAVCLTRLALAAAFGPGHAVRDQKTLNLGRRNQPEPDVAVVSGDPRDYATKHPTMAILLVEVADSSLLYDRVIKAHRYALAGITDYWIVNLVDRQLEVYRNPGPDPARPGRFRYADLTIVPADGHASPLGKQDQQVAVVDLLP